MKKEPLRIAISGLSGCGNTTVSLLLARELGLSCVNYTFRNLAQEKGISFEEMHMLAESDDQWDNYLDRYQVELAMEGSCILASRLAIWFLVEADCRIYLKTSPEVRFSRIAKREGFSLEESKARTLLRDDRDIARYKRLYGINLLDFSLADFILSTDYISPEEIVQKIINHLREKNLI